MTVFLGKTFSFSIFVLSIYTPQVSGQQVKTDMGGGLRFSRGVFKFYCFGMGKGHALLVPNQID